MALANPCAESPIPCTCEGGGRGRWEGRMVVREDGRGEGRRGKGNGGRWGEKEQNHSDIN